MNNTSTNINNISVVIPCFNEEGNIALIYSQIRAILALAEIIFVDDGSHDQTWGIISELAQKDSQVKAIRFTRNFGAQAALEAGLRKSTGAAVITIDCDLQHPVNLIPQLIEAWDQGAGSLIVNTTRIKTEGEPFSKRLCSAIFYGLFNLVSEVKIPSSSSDFRLLDRKVVNFIMQIPQRNKFFRGLVPWTGFSSTCISYKANARHSGQASYNMSKNFELARLGITFFSYLPLKLIVVFGLFLSICSILLFLVCLVSKFFYPDLFSSAALFGSFVLANSGIIIVILGISSLYQINLYKELQGLPAYIVSEEK